MKVSALIPYRPDGGWRDRLWAWNSRQWKTLCPDVEVVLGGYDAEPGEPFNAGRAINAAGDRATGDVFVTVAADFLPDPTNITAACQLLDDDVPWVALWSHTGLLTQDSTSRLIYDETTAHRFEAVVPVNNAGHVLPRETWFDVGGVDERFNGWGPEDLAFRTALATLHGPGSLVDGTCVHLWHPRREEGDEFLHRQLNKHYFHDVYVPADGKPKAMRAVVEAAKAARCS